MPLPQRPSSLGRRPVHLRTVWMQGYHRTDGLYEIEGRVSDSKNLDFCPPAGNRLVEAGDFIHDLWIRFAVDTDMVIHEIESVSDATPYPLCSEGGVNLQRLVGSRIAAGWSNEVKRKMGRSSGCTHLMELLIPMGTAAFQTIAEFRLARPPKLDASGKPFKVDSCSAYAADRGVVAKLYPKFYSGRQDPDAARADAEFANPDQSRSP
jgi:hypothetical protein